MFSIEITNKALHYLIVCTVLGICSYNLGNIIYIVCQKTTLPYVESNGHYKNYMIVIDINLYGYILL